MLQWESVSIPNRKVLFLNPTDGTEPRYGSPVELWVEFENLHWLTLDEIGFLLVSNPKWSSQTIDKKSITLKDLPSPYFSEVSISFCSLRKPWLAKAMNKCSMYQIAWIPTIANREWATLVVEYVPSPLQLTMSWSLQNLPKHLYYTYWKIGVLWSQWYCLDKIKMPQKGKGIFFKVTSSLSIINLIFFRSDWWNPWFQMKDLQKRLEDVICGKTRYFDECI